MFIYSIFVIWDKYKISEIPKSQGTIQSGQRWWECGTYYQFQSNPRLLYQVGLSACGTS